MRDYVSCHVTTVAVHDEEAACLWVLRPRLWLEDGSQPLVRMTVGRPATVAGRESPVARRMGWYPGRVGVLCLKDDQRRDCSTGSTYALDIHSCRPVMIFQLDFSRTLTNALEG